MPRLSTRDLSGGPQPLSQAFRPLTGRMQHAQNDNRIIHHTVRCDIGRARDHQFPGLEHPSRTAEAGLFRQQSNRVEDTLGYLSCRSRVDLRDMLPYSLQIMTSPAMPCYLHEGGSTSPSVPQWSSHLTTVACSTRSACSLSSSSTAVWMAATCQASCSI